MLRRIPDTLPPSKTKGGPSDVKAGDDDGGRYAEIKRLLGLKIPIIKISETMKRTERTVCQIRDGQALAPNVAKEIPGPVWMQPLDWQLILSEVLDGHSIKFIWAERASGGRLHWRPHSVD